MSNAEFMGEIKIKSTAEIVKDSKAAGKSKEEAWDEAYGGVNMPWFVKGILAVCVILYLTFGLCMTIIFLC